MLKVRNFVTRVRSAEADLGIFTTMLSYSRAFYELKNMLQPLYDEREATAMAHEVIQHITGLDKTKRLLQKDVLFTEKQQQQYEQMNKALLTGKPLQYVTRSAWFMGREFFVNEHVLIPRPETEELVGWVVADSRKSIVESIKSKVESRESEVESIKSKVESRELGVESGESGIEGRELRVEGMHSEFRILDIGTGSGCIAVSLKLALPEAVVTSCDISIEALGVARENAKRLNADVAFLQLDFLDAATHNKLHAYDVIVSNPPYIPAEEKERLHRNVKDHEPGIALFVPDNDALVFYKAIALFGKEHLNSNGYIYCEMDAAHAMECKALFEDAGYRNVEIRKDMHGSWRMLKCGIGDQG